MVDWRFPSDAMPLGRPLTVRAYQLLLVLAAVAPGALLTSALVTRTMDANRAVLERRLVEAARIDAAAIDREFEGTIRALQALATSPLLTTDDLAGFYAEAQRVREAQASWYTVVVLSVDGQQLLNTMRRLGEPLPRATEPESLAELVATGRPIVGRVRRDPRVPDVQRFAVRVPVVRDGRIKYVLTAAINASSLGALVRRDDAPLEGWTRAILDPDGTIAARSAGAPLVGDRVGGAGLASIAASPEQVIRQLMSDGSEAYAGVGRTAFGWMSLVVVPVALFDAAARGSTIALLTGGALAMLGGLVAAVAISRRLQREFTAAAAAADALAHGHPLPPARARVAEGQRLQESLQRAAALLRQRQRERDDQIERAEAARAEAEEANHTKDHFLAVLGHELRNPLAPAVTALEIMRQADPTRFVRERQVLERQLSHMKRLVDDLLDVSRLARDKMPLHRTRFELHAVVDRALDMVRTLVAQRGHELRVDVPATGLPLEADEDRIVQVLTNLLVNAAKYTPPHGRLRIAARAEGDAVVIACEDNGPGVPPQLAAALFQPFAQGPRLRDREHGGLGLGLALARSLTELHGGTIHVEDHSPPPGSCFVVRLPLASGVGEPSHPPSPPPGAASAVRRILVVDDNADAREMLRDGLESLGHAVTTAGDGPSALAAAAGCRPDVAVLDIGLPGMDGYQLAGRLRRQHPSIRLLSVTGYGQPGDAAAAARAGFHAHLVKPVRLADLVEHIEAEALTICPQASPASVAAPGTNTESCRSAPLDSSA